MAELRRGPPARNVLKREKESGKRVVLRRGRDVAIGGEPVEERRYLCCARFGRVALVVMKDKVANSEPADISRAPAELPRADRRTNAIDQPRCRHATRAR